MIRYIKLKNYRSLTDFELNLASKNNTPVKFAVIYGENGSGKSSIISVFDMLYESFQTMNIKNTIMHFLAEHPDHEYADKLKNINKYTDITRIIRNNKTIGSDDNMSIELGFYLNGKNGSYLIEFDSEQVVHERLEFTLNHNRGVYFDITQDSERINDSVFKGVKGDLSTMINKYWGKHSVISLINNIKEEFSNNYFKSNVSESFIQLLDYLNSVYVYMADSDSKSGIIDNKMILPPEQIASGSISVSNSNALDIAERALNKYFKSMYRDITNVFYKREQNNDFIEYDLYFTRYISGKNRIIHYSDESCGTNNLMYLLPYCLAAANGLVVAIDEIDNGIHDVLLCNMLKNLYSNISGQLIITTHNIMLLNEYAFKDSFYFIEILEDGSRRINTPADSGYRIQPDSNVIMNYLKNIFKGLPWNEMNIDFKDISSVTNQQN